MTPLKHCPRCRYNLRGLPARHTCPECGFAYDPDCVIIRLRGWRKRDVWSILGLGGILIAVLVDAFRPPFYGRPAEWLRALAYLGLPVAWLGYYVARARFNRRAVIINHLGVTFDTPTIRVRFVPWSDIGRATFDWKTERFCVEGRDGNPIVSCDAEGLSTSGVADKCAYEINEAKAVYLDGAADTRGLPSPCPFPARAGDDD